MKIAALLVDLDDTLVAFDAVTEESWNEVLNRYQKENPDIDRPTLKGAIEERSRWYWGDPERHRVGRNDIGATRRKIVAEAFSRLGLPERDAVVVADSYSRVRLSRMYLLPGAVETLSELRSRGIRLAMVTNGDAPGQRSKIERFGLESYFDHILIEGEVGFGKPDPRVYETALAKLEARPSETGMVGDNIVWDVGGPQKLGLRGIWIDRKREGVPLGTEVVPDHVLASVTELPALIDNQSGDSGKGPAPPPT
jgi:putative hydrolase of the HAD superfamily